MEGKGFTVVYGVEGCEKHKRFREQKTGRWKSLSDKAIAAFHIIYAYQHLEFQIFEERCDYCKNPRRRKHGAILQEAYQAGKAG